MRKTVVLVISLTLALVTSAGSAGMWERFKAIITQPTRASIDVNTIVSALKEALSQGTTSAISSAGRLDGYFGNPAIKIPIPEQIRVVADMLEKVGFRKLVNDFVVSMNRAAEDAAPHAKTFFIDSIRQMTFADAKEILDGENTAATSYFRAKTYDKLYAAFQPSISTSMNEAGVTRHYKSMIDKYRNLPFVKAISLDLDDYVTTKSLDGLFHMVGEEEKRIRTDPAARATELLQTVFGSK